MKAFRTLYILAALLIANGSLHAQLLRLANVAVDAPALDMFIDSASSPSASGILDAHATHLVPVAPGNHHMTIATSGSPVTFGVYDVLINARQDSAYTMVLSGSTELDHLLLSKPIARTVPQDSTLVQFVNLSRSLGSIDLDASVGNSGSFTHDGVAYKGVTTYRMVPATDLTLLIAPAGGAPIHKAIGYMVPGGVISVLITGDYDPTNPDRLRIYHLIDSDSNAQAPMLRFSQAPLQQGEFRIVHAAAKLGPIDLFVDSRSSDSLPLSFRHASAKRDDLLGLHRVALTIQGTGLANTLMTADVSIRPDTTTTLVFVGTGGTSSLGSVLLTSHDGVAPTDGRTALRILNASADFQSLDVTAVFSDSSTRTFNALDFKESTEFTLVPAGAVRLSIGEPGSSTPVMVVGGGLPANEAVTAIIVGTREDTTLSLSLLAEDNSQEQEPMLLFSFLTISSAPGSGNLRNVEATIAPNPARDGHVHLVYAAPSGRARIALYDMLGRQALLLDDEAFESGRRSIAIPTESLTSGAYNVMMLEEDGERVGLGRLVIVK